MRKFLIPALASAALLAAVSSASAGYWLNGIYYPTCVWNAFGYVCY
jgi:hypothetical protein